MGDQSQGVSPDTQATSPENTTTSDGPKLSGACIGCRGVLIEPEEKNDLLCAKCKIRYGKDDNFFPPSLPRSPIAAFKHEPSAWFKCPGCDEEFQALTPSGKCIGCDERAEEAARKAATTKERMVEMMGELGENDYRFDKFDRSLCPEAFDKANAFNPGVTNLLLYGPAGSGKSHLAGAIARRFFESLGPSRVEYHEAIPLMRWFQMRSRGDTEDEIRRLVRLDVLVIDDLGSEKDSEAVLGRLYEIVQGRYKARRKGLVVTTNLPPSLLSEKLDDDRIVSRLTSMCGTENVVKVDAPDYRLNHRQ